MSLLQIVLMFVDVLAYFYLGSEMSSAMGRAGFSEKKYATSLVALTSLFLASLIALAIGTGASPIE